MCLSRGNFRTTTVTGPKVVSTEVCVAGCTKPVVLQIALPGPYPKCIGTFAAAIESAVPERHFIMKISNKIFLSFCLTMTAAAFLVVSTGVAQTANSKSATPAPATAKNSGHASESLSTSSDSAAPKTHDTVEYKDPEDMTTRYRPGNNTPATSTADPAQSDASAKKHVAGVKYENRQVALPACDGASKDAAKCVASPPAAPPNGKDSAPATQDSKRTNKIDSFTVKQ
jgi:hypothetical protein